jgi:hypothetical protein
MLLQGVADLTVVGGSFFAVRGWSLAVVKGRNTAGFPVTSYLRTDLLS